MADDANSIVSDLTKVPNFEAVDAWLEKLKAWCEDAREEIETLHAVGNPEQAAQILGLDQRIEDLEPRAGAFDSLAELVFDVDRGVRDISEVIDWLKGRGFEA